MVWKTLLSYKNKADLKAKMMKGKSKTQPVKSSVKIIYEWQVSHKQEIVCPDLTPEVAGCFSWGHKEGTAVYHWLQTVKWQSPASSQDDFGITYLELLFNFVLVTGCMLPVTISKRVQLHISVNLINHRRLFCPNGLNRLQHRGWCWYT